MAQFYSDLFTLKEVVLYAEAKIYSFWFALSPALQNSEQTKLAALSQLSALNFCLTVHIEL